VASLDRNIQIRSFFGIDQKDKQNDLKYNFSNYTERMPKGFFPIASAEGGNIICISYKKNPGEIYFWDHESEVDIGETPTMKNMYFLAESFSNFIEKLKKFDSSKVEVKDEDIISSWIDPDFLKSLEDK
jgi:hypothetical protein